MTKSKNVERKESRPISKELAPPKNKFSSLDEKMKYHAKIPKRPAIFFYIVTNYKEMSNSLRYTIEEELYTINFVVEKYISHITNIKNMEKHLLKMTPSLK